MSGEEEDVPGEAGVVPAELRRIRSLKERYKSIMADKQAVRMALSGKTLGNKKVKFDEEEEEEEAEPKSSVLFDDSGSESEGELERRFRTDKPEGVVAMRARFADDPRFAPDERFFGEEEEEGEGEEGGERDEEEKVQGDVLEAVLGYRPSKRRSEEKPSVVRFDPLKHAAMEEEALRKRRLARVEERASEKPKEPPVDGRLAPVLLARFYSVKDDIKEIIKSDENGRGFSLLETFGPVQEKNERKKKKKKGTEEMRTTGARTLGVSNPFRYDSSESEAEEAGERGPSFRRRDVFLELEVRRGGGGGRSEEPFFFSVDDPRLKEGLEFSAGGRPVVSAVDFDRRRKQLKGYVRYKANHSAVKFTKMSKIGAPKKKRFFRNRKK